MVLAPLHEPQAAPSKLRTRLALLITGVGLLGAVGGFYAFSSHVVHDHEARVIAGDFPNIHLEPGPFVIDGNGKASKLLESIKENRYVASLNLIPPGNYQEVLETRNDNPKDPTDMVIAGRDSGGHWHPDTAAQLLVRLKVGQRDEAK